MTAQHPAQLRAVDRARRRRRLGRNLQGAGARHRQGLLPRAAPTAGDATAPTGPRQARWNMRRHADSPDPCWPGRSAGRPAERRRPAPKRAPAPARSSPSTPRPILEAIDVGRLRGPRSAAQEETPTTPPRRPTWSRSATSSRSTSTSWSRWSTPGPGRAIPEPEHVDTVKIGFLGPIEATVSVATGGKSHEEPLGIADAARRAAGDRGGQRARRLPRAADPLRAGRAQRQRSVGRLGQRDRRPGLQGEGLGDPRHDRRRQQPHRHPRRPQGRDPDDQHRRHRSDLHRDQHPLGRPHASATTGSRATCWSTTCIASWVSSGWRSSAPATATAASACARSRDGSRRLGHPIVMEMAYRVGGEDFSLQLDRVCGGRAPGDRALGRRRSTAPGSSTRCASVGMRAAVLRSRPLRLATSSSSWPASNAEGGALHLPVEPGPQGPEARGLPRRASVERFGVEPDTYAAHAYDGMNMLLWAIQNAGLNRAKIRDVLAYRSEPWPGVTGRHPAERRDGRRRRGLLRPLGR